MHRTSYRGGHAVAVRRWKNDHPEEWREQKSRVKENNQEETEVNAVNTYKPWTLKDVRFLRRYGSRLTAKEIAIALGRTYFAVQGKARDEGIDLRGDKMGANSVRFRRILLPD